MSKRRGFVQYRSRQLVDVSIGFGDEDQAQVGADRAVHISTDGNRRAEELINVTHKKRRLNPKHLNDVLARWIPAENEDDLDPDLADQISAVPDNLGSSAKRKFYTSSDDPMAEWRPMKQFFLDELIWGEGLGDAPPYCTMCEKELDTERIFKCAECGEWMQCKGCCLERHALTPLHLIKEWKTEFWEPVSLRDVGLICQLGHGGASCPFPSAKTLRSRSLGDNQHLVQLLRNRWYPATVTDPATCASFNVLELFRLLNVVGNVNCHDFMGSLERLTDGASATGMKWMPDRYKQFVRMSRQYAFLQSCKRQGRTHDPAGLEATQRGELTPKCWPCPQVDRNLPNGWRDVDPAYRFLYMLIVALDANFKLRNRLRKNEINDPSLGPGWGAFVEPTEYKAHLKNYVAEKDISTCIAFAALLQKDTRMTTGLRVSGVGGCVCARHECMLPNGLGDLQKGERYANMDYILMSALAGFALLALTVSYDIACQWRKNLAQRNGKLDDRIQLDLERVDVHCGIPVWHAGSHEKECEDENSLKFLEGVGKSDGEGIERFWADVGPAAYQTKDMGLGNRADSLENKIDYHNHQKNLSQGDALRRKLIVALAERARQVEAFEEVSSTISKDLQREWRAQITAFVNDHTKPNPYSLKKSDLPTEAETRLALKADEEAEARRGGAPIHGTSVTAFLVAGLQVEDAQRRIIAETAGLALMTADREGKLQERRLALISKLRKLRNLQQIYTPAAIAAMERQETARDPDAPPAPIEKTKLYLPSGLTEQERVTGCQRGIVGMEAKLRLAQCGDALANIRSRLHGKRFLIMFRDGNVTGQVRATKSRTLIESVGDRVTASAQKYTQARTALIELQGVDSIPHFKELKPQDLTLDGQVEDPDAAAVKKLKMIQAGKGKRTPCHIKGSSKQVMSWIWSAQGSMDSSEEDLHESMRIEWSRALARKTRWCEEVMLLREEMRRVLRYLEWQAGWWEQRKTGREHQVSPGLQKGLAAYAAKQAAFHRRLAVFFKAEWSVSVGQAAKSVVAAVTVDDDVPDLDQLFGEGASLNV
ncbi:hypothetical protein C8F04DRAFT_1258078 [Mycena alexandri]|uniref:CxC2-like cysteine cluster KDZ transposase-associated domain-containing protein n=1 Tax=Mycena alexandri TaxID=1745969 RepID=A0AAD6X4C6_9AGAR|nr:hypothetical protein C8F04DRAFT_1258078 [Mycena alexandri]